MVAEITPRTCGVAGTAVTCCIGEVAPVKLASPRYRALMACMPGETYVTVQVAISFDIC
jgi:hypothetical protein